MPDGGAAGANDTGLRVEGRNREADVNCGARSAYTLPSGNASRGTPIKSTSSTDTPRCLTDMILPRTDVVAA
jgi:hypothetical protein